MIPPTVDAWRGAPSVAPAAPGDALVVSPELALVDAALRDEALALLPDVQPFAFLELRDLPLPEGDWPEWLFARRAPAVRRQTPTLAVAAAAYLTQAVIRTVVFNLVVFAAVAALVFLVNLAA